MTKKYFAIASMAAMGAVGTLALGVAPAHAASPAFACSWDQGSKTAYSCTVSQTNTTATTTETLTVPTGTGLSIHTGDSPMLVPGTSDQSGTMTVTDAGPGATAGTENYTVTEAFSDAYVAAHPNNLQVSATLTGTVNTNGNPGPWTQTLGGTNATLTNPGNYCDSACQGSQPMYGIWKVAYEAATDKTTGHPTVGSMLVFGANNVPAMMGKKLVITDTVDSKTLKDAHGNAECTAVMKYNFPGEQQTPVEDIPGNDVAYSIKGDLITASYTIPTTNMRWNSSYTLNTQCDVPTAATAQTYTDNGVVNGTKVSAHVTVAANSATGTGNGPTKPQMVTYTRLVQSDRYMPVIKGNAAATRANEATVRKGIAAGVLSYREDMGTKCNVKKSPTCMWYHTTNAIKPVTLTLPKGTAPTTAEWIAAANKVFASTTGSVSSTSRTTAVTGTTTVDWFLGTGATASAPWGAHHTVNQTLLARS